MIYLRKVLDMLLLSMLPSVISFLAMWSYMRYQTWFIGCILSTIVFFGGNLLLIRRFTRDILSREMYYRVWILTFVVYTALGALLLYNQWMYPFTWIYFHTRIISIITMPSGDKVPEWISFSISMAAFLACILAARPMFEKSYQLELEADREDRKKYMKYVHKEESEFVAPPKYKEKHRIRIRDEEDQSKYSERDYYRLQRKGNYEKKGSVGILKADVKLKDQIVSKVSNFFLNMGSYYFYQRIEEKRDEGANTYEFIKIYIKRKMRIKR